MLHQRMPARRVLNSHDIEAVLIRGPALAKNPAGGHPGDLSLLALTDGFDRGTAGARPAGFYLHEGHGVAPPDNQVQVMPAQLEPVGFDRPAAGSEEGDGDLFAPEPKELALIFPFGRRAQTAPKTGWPTRMCQGQAP